MASNIAELVSSIEIELEAAEKRERKARMESKLILDTASKESRANLTPEETERFETLRAGMDNAKSEIAGIKDKLARALDIQAQEAESDKRAKESRENAKPARPNYDEVARVGNEERQYHKGNDPSGAKFLRDVVRHTMNRDPDSGVRLARHMQEERVERAEYLERTAGDIATTGLGGLVVPQYLVDMTAPAVANMRPFADACNQHVLPADGMTVTIPTISTATSAALQATQLVAPAGTSIAETDLTINVQTAEGWQNVSRQAIDRGAGIADVVMQDLFKRYATVLDNTLINQATTGLDAKSVTNTYTDAAPTGPKVYTKIVAGMSAVEAALLAMGQPTHVVMHSRRWYWLQSQFTSTWPMIQGGLSAAGQNYSAAYGSGIRGQLPNGMAVVVDNNIVTNLGASTNQDRVYVVCHDECHLWEAPNQPVFIRAEQPNATALGVLLVVYGYFAYTFARYSNAVQNIDGTGLITPAF